MSLLACRRERFINNFTIRKHPRALPFTEFTNSFSMLFFIIYLEIKIRFYCVTFNILQENIYSISSRQLPFTNCLQDAKQSDMWSRKSLYAMIDPIVSVPIGLLYKFCPYVYFHAKQHSRSQSPSWKWLHGHSSHRVVPGFCPRVQTYSCRATNQYIVVIRKRLRSQTMFRTNECEWGMSEFI